MTDDVHKLIEEARARFPVSADMPLPDYALTHWGDASLCVALATALTAALERAERAEADAARMREAIAWALGCRADFDVPNDCEKRRYWWRTELAKRAGVIGYLAGEPAWGATPEQFTRRDLPEDAMGDYSRAGIDPHPDDRKGQS